MGDIEKALPDKQPERTMWQARKPEDQHSFTVTEAFKAAFERCGYVVTKVPA